MKYLQITTLFISICLFTSCDLNFVIDQVEGNGNIVREEIIFKESFNEIRGSNGLDIIIMEANVAGVVIEADENLHQYIVTEVKNGKLYIKTTKNIRNAASKKITVAYTGPLSAIEASSGADVQAVSLLTSDELFLKSSSGADLEADVMAKKLTAQTSSGADLKVSGETVDFTAKASSGSDLDAENLIAQNGAAKASSGSSIVLNILNNLNAKASSGARIRYEGKPLNIAVDKSSGGNVTKL